MIFVSLRKTPFYIEDGKMVEIMNPLMTQELFKKIPLEDVPFLCLGDNRPENMIWTHIPVPPRAIRPSTDSIQGKSTEDAITMYLWKVETLGHNLQDILSGKKSRELYELWEELQAVVAYYINSETNVKSQLFAPKSKKDRGIVQRIKGKQGRFRMNLSGKRVNFTARTVISPDPNLLLDQVGVPKEVAKTLSFPEMVNKHNIKYMKQAVMNGVDRWPGARYVTDGMTGDKRYLSNKKICILASGSLKIGDTVERHLFHGDNVLFNRQPSLHRLSMMSHCTV